MRVAILGTRGIPARYGGFETFAEQLAIRLVNHGHHVTVFCENSGQAIGEYKGTRLQYIDAPSFLGAFRPMVFDALSLWQARKGYDVVYMLGYGTSLLCWIPRLYGTRVWINMDGIEWQRAKWSWVARKYLRLAEALATITPNRIIADAAAIKHSLITRYKRLPPCDVIPYGCDIVESANAGLLSEFGLSPDGYFLAVCRLEPENHVVEIIEGFGLSRSRSRLIIVGDHKLDTSYVKKLQTYRDPRISFVGPVYGQRLQALRYFCKAYLHGHSVGGTNPSLLEAMGCGNVVIAHDNSFNREVLGEGFRFFTQPHDVCAALELIELGGADTDGIRERALGRARQFYDWDNIGGHYCELLDLNPDNAKVVDYSPNGTL